MTEPAPETATEGRRARAGRLTRRTALYVWAAILIITGILLVILIAQNTRHVRVGWILGHSTVSLVYLILAAALLGWVLGLATNIVFRRRTRRQHG
jgi:uncharacterized integral membrane protein